MRELNVIIDDVKKVSADISSKQKKKDEAEKAYTDASKALAEAQQVGADLKLELEQSLGLLVPSSLTGRVRTS